LYTALYFLLAAMKKYFLPLFYTFSVCLHAQTESVPQSKIDSLFQQWNNPSSPGMALGIIKGGKLVYTHGYGMADLEHDVPITDTTLFYIGSVSKQFVSMSILLLEEEGKLHLDDPIQIYFPDFPQYNAPLTIRHFIHHTSGVRDDFTLLALAGKDYLDHIDKEENYEMIRRQKELNFTPGEKYLYSNSCYFMLALIIEKITGVSLNEFAQQHIFKPLGMHHTFFLDDNTRIVKNRAMSYLLENGKLKNQLLRYDLVGSGGIYSSLGDLYLWDQNFYHNKLGKGKQALIDTMLSEGTLNSGKKSGYAFGIHNGVYRGLKTENHGGSLAGYRSYLLRFPQQQVSIILLGNLAPAPTASLPYTIADWLLEKQLTPLPELNSSKTQNSTKATQTAKTETTIDHKEQYTGDFYSEELDVSYQITLKNSDLYCSINSKSPLILQWREKDVFVMHTTEYDVALRFVKNKQGETSGFTVDAGRVTNLHFRRK
jgi:CubicO group peptidase (beta-lactamase class C family)